MKISYKIATVVVPVSIVAFILSRVIWPDPVGVIGPDASLVPHFMFIGALEAISFGFGIAFLVFGWLHFRGRIRESYLSTATFIAVGWLLVSWWPHDNMHRVNGMENYAGLIRIEYMFHLTLILAGLTLAVYLWRQLKMPSPISGSHL